MTCDKYFKAGEWVYARCICYRRHLFIKMTRSKFRDELLVKIEKDIVLLHKRLCI